MATRAAPARPPRLAWLPKPKPPARGGSSGSSVRGAALVPPCPSSESPGPSTERAGARGPLRNAPAGIGNGRSRRVQDGDSGRTSHWSGAGAQLIVASSAVPIPRVRRGAGAPAGSSSSSRSFVTVSNSARASTTSGKSASGRLSTASFGAALSSPGDAHSARPTASQSPRCPDVRRGNMPAGGSRGEPCPPPNRKPLHFHLHTDRRRTALGVT